MQNGREQQGLLQRIDQMMEELQLLRREVADLLVREAEANAKAASATTATKVAVAAREKTAAELESLAKSNPSLSGISSLEELNTLDFVRGEEQPMEAPSEEPILDFIAKTDPEAKIDELFVARGSEEVLESAFEPALHFDLIDNLTIADKYLFANELFFGNQADLIEMLEEVERMSSWSQVEHYLYDVRGFGKDEESAKLLATFIQEHSR
ncbi:hypothetical protein [Porphyromonas levii]|uniref:Uncharacterized protein n=1 Tax=Porphyromonas levii TaxID=28114 RepID=A0A4Y8WNY5_9PORP|nr:hypothetical protein [Porphyromonas levii]MBR8703979.1 hypothetical protein [Porphyromonas levii]MBR8713807.1 hypothetical protein [Porphyromonas levii]MBR8715811.1 hypothetical protein [Porphyromonas levii]MBR8728359.1 hypothetical protein [Porphyromonas levii]MBR8736679.1 hypothetical protein [Porphyromonas levii]